MRPRIGSVLVLAGAAVVLAFEPERVELREDGAEPVELRWRRR